MATNQNNPQITYNIVPTKQDFYLVTRQQINAYADMGIFLNFIISLLMINVTATVAFWIAEKQCGNNIALANQFNIARYYSIGTLILFLLLSLIIAFIQLRRRQDLFSARADLEK